MKDDNVTTLDSIASNGSKSINDDFVTNL